MGLFDRFRRKSAGYAKGKPNQLATADDTTRFRGVQVVANGEGCCQAARDLEGKRFLLSQVPILPLRGCDTPECKCSYERFEDRRSDLRRAADVSFDVRTQFQDEEHRSAYKPGRRDDDGDR